MIAAAIIPDCGKCVYDTLAGIIAWLAAARLHVKPRVELYRLYVCACVRACVRPNGVCEPAYGSLRCPAAGAFGLNLRTKTT